MQNIIAQLEEKGEFKLASKLKKIIATATDKNKKRKKLAQLAEARKEALLKLFDGKIDLQTHDRMTDEIDGDIRDILDDMGIE